MVTIKKTENDGSLHEISFSSTLEATKALGALFNVELAESVQRQEQRQALNDALRQEWRRGGASSTDDVQKLFDAARHNM